MWMMGYNEPGEFDSIQDSCNHQRLRPIIPKPIGAPPPSCFPCIHGADLLALNHHLAIAEQSKRELNTQQVVVSSRWNPTPEQLQALEDLYRRGTRTPSAEQIQQITAHLRRYGKIEGKNVFYWFQNHKARERQKRRRDEPQPHIQINNNHTHDSEKKDLSTDDCIAGENRTVLYEVDQTMNWASPTNSSTTNAGEKTVSTQEAAKAEAAAAAAELIKANGWVQFEDGADLQLQRRNATWHMMNLSCSSPSNSTTCITVSSTVGLMEKHRHHGFNIQTNYMQPYINNNVQSHGDEYGGDGDQAQILQLFPLDSDRQQKEEDFGNCDPKKDGEESKGREAMMNAAATPYQFYEFLPLKN